MNTKTSLASLIGIGMVCGSLALVTTGCAVVGPSHQRLVSKPDMVFSTAAAFGYDNELLLQVEPGSSFCGGAPSGGCTSCK